MVTERASRSRRARLRVAGFTLVELMVVVALIGILATLAITGVRRYLATSRTAEAKQAVGGIRVAVIVRNERIVSEALAEGTEGSAAGGPAKGKGKGAAVTMGAPGLCGKSIAVPKSLQTQGRKYQPSSVDGEDYQTGDVATGWKCLGFEISQPQYYQYQYKLGGPPISVKLPGGGSPVGIPADRAWSAWGRGDLDGDGRISWFMANGYTRNGGIITNTQLYVQDETE